MFDFISVTESVHLFHTCSISTEIASHTVWNHVRKHRRVPLGQKHNTGISSLWAQLEKGQREQWANCVPVGALQGNYVPAIHKGGRIISRKQVSLPPPHPHEAIYWRQRELWASGVQAKKSGNYSAADDTGRQKCQCEGAKKKTKNKTESGILK